MRAAFPDLHLSVEDVITEGDRVAFRGVVRGTHQGAFLGIPPTGKQATIFAFDVVRIEHGKLIEHWGGPDLFTLLLQLGAVVSAGPEKN
jgi:predicted ester cyclase